MTDLYRDLNVPKDASGDDIKKSYRRMARKYHPDVSKEEDAEGKFKAIQLAYDVLSDPGRRSEYDKTGRTKPEDPQNAAISMAAHAFKVALQRTLDIPWADQVRTANLVLDEMQDTINKQLEQCKTAIGKFKRHKGRVRAKGGSRTPNLYEAIVDAEIERAEQMALNHPKVLKNIQDARKLLEEFESPPGEGPRLLQVDSVQDFHKRYSGGW